MIQLIDLIRIPCFSLNMFGLTNLTRFKVNPCILIYLIGYVPGVFWLFYLYSTGIARGENWMKMDLSLLLTVCMTFIKANSAISQIGQLREIRATLQTDKLNQFNVKHQDILVETNKYITKVIKLMGILYYVLAFNVIASPLFDSLFSGIQNPNIEKLGIDPNNSYAMWYVPNDQLINFNYFFFPLFQYIFVHFSFFAMMSCSIAFCVDGFLVASFTTIKTLFQILNAEFMAVFDDEPDCNTVIERLNTNVKFHNDCLDLMNTVFRFYDIIIFNQVFNTLLVLCFVGITLTTTEVGSPEFNESVSYLSAVMFQVFLECHYGQQITNEVELISFSIYSSIWYNYKCECKEKSHYIKVKKHILVIMEWNTRNVEMKCGHLVVLNHEMFSWILNNAYAAFAILSKANG